MQVGRDLPGGNARGRSLMSIIPCCYSTVTQEKLRRMIAPISDYAHVGRPTFVPSTVNRDHTGESSFRC